jgi:hypothetical protein
VTRVPISIIVQLSSWESWEKRHFVIAPMVNHRKYYKGEVGGFPQSLGHGESCESMYDCGSSVHQKCSNYAIIGSFFDLCILIWIIDPLVIHPSPHPRVPTHPSYLRSVTSEITYPNLFIFRCFHFGARLWVFQGVWGCVIISLSFI